MPRSYLTFKLFAYNLYVRLITQQVQLVPDAIEGTDVFPVPASTLAANSDTQREINLPRLSPMDTSGKGSYNGSGPWRLIQYSLGKIVGKASDADGKTARISFGLRKMADVKGDLHEAAKSAAAEPAVGLSPNEVEVSPQATSMAGSAPRDPALHTADVPITHAKSPQVAALVGPRFNPMDRMNRRNRMNRSEFVICFSSRNIAIVGVTIYKMRGIKSLRTQREVLAKGNIIPFLCRSVASCCAISQTSSTQSILKIFNINVRLIESAAGLVVNLVNYSMGASRVHERDCGKRRPQRNKKTEADIYGRVH